jgi:hypothetical protein
VIDRRLVRSDEKAECDDGPSMPATVDHDGKFRIDDAPVGQYTLSVSFSRYATRARRRNRSIWER